MQSAGIELGSLELWARATTTGLPFRAGEQPLGSLLHLLRYKEKSVESYSKLSPMKRKVDNFYELLVSSTFSGWSGNLGHELLLECFEWAISGLYFLLFTFLGNYRTIVQSPVSSDSVSILSWWEWNCWPMVSDATAPTNWATTSAHRSNVWFVWTREEWSQ